MLSFFRTNQILTSILLIFYILILWASHLVVPFSISLEPTAILSKYVINFAGADSWVGIGIAIVLLLLNATIINYIVSEHRLANEVNLFPGLFYILISSSIPDFLHLSPILMANTFFLFAIMSLLKIYKNSACSDLIFNVGFWVAVSSFFYFSFSIFLLWGIIGLAILRAFRLNELFILICGFFVPYLLLGVYFFWFDRFGYFWESQVLNNLGFLEISKIELDLMPLKIGVFALLILFLVLSSGQYNFKKNIQVQKKVSIFFWILFFVGLSTLIQSNFNLTHLQMLAIPGGIFLGMTFVDLKKQWAEAIHFILLFLVLALQYKSLLI